MTRLLRQPQRHNGLGWARNTQHALTRRAHGDGQGKERRFAPTGCRSGALHRPCCPLRGAKRTRKARGSQSPVRRANWEGVRVAPKAVCNMPTRLDQGPHVPRPRFVAAGQAVDRAKAGRSQRSECNFDG